MPLVLVPVDGGRSVPLDKAIIYLGRGGDCDVVLNSSRKISRKHCCVAQIHDFVLVRDLGSMNGVRINEIVIDTEARLNLGDELWIGDVGFRLHAVGKDGKAVRPTRKDPKREVPRVDPRMMSTELPVAIPEDGTDFLVEQSYEQPVIPPSEIVKLSDDE